MNIPYSGATSGTKAREDIGKILKTFGCSSVAWLDDYETNSIALGFVFNGKRVQMKASANGWASMYLRKKPWTNRMHRTKSEYENQALKQGMIAVNSILRDWVKGQITAVESGILRFDHVFLPYMLTHDGTTLAESSEVLKLLGHDNS